MAVPRRRDLCPCHATNEAETATPPAKTKVAHGESCISMPYLEAIGLSAGRAARKTLAHLLRQAGADEPLSPPADADEARADIIRQVGSELNVGPPLLPPGRERAAEFASTV